MSDLKEFAFQENGRQGGFPASLLSMRGFFALLLTGATCLSPVLSLLHAQSQKSAKDLLQLNYLATGGVNWNIHAQAEIEGDINIAGATGTFHQIVDLKQGRDATSIQAGPINMEQVTLTDSSWQIDQSAIVTYADTPDARTDAINQSFIDRNGWFSASTNALSNYVGTKQDRGTTYDLVSVTPSGGRSITLWLGATDHLLYRIDQLDASHHLNNIFLSDYRNIAGVLIPFTTRQSNGDANQDTTQTVKKCDFPLRSTRLYSLRLHPLSRMLVYSEIKTLPPFHSASPMDVSLLKSRSTGRLRFLFCSIRARAITLRLKQQSIWA